MTMSQYLAKVVRLNNGWKLTDAGTIKITYPNGAWCELLRDALGRCWLVVNCADNGAKWVQQHSSFKKVLEALQK